MDQTLTLAFSLHSGPGAYALLLGSGISRAAGIPTGWDVTVDLIGKLSAVVGAAEEALPDPSVWYAERYGEEPDYSRVVDRLAGSPEDRRQLLEGYFEPDEQDREEGKKLPTEAHRAVAELVTGGYIKVIVTTNFDKLMERALEAAGVTPTVISTPDDAEGAPPLQHTRCTVIKVHGDYLDARIKNTPAELTEYDPRTDALLDRVFDEYGLIVCGWSGEYDTALVNALKRARSRRYTTYWASYGEPSQTERQLTEFVRGRVIETRGADTFFRTLSEKVQALEDYGGHHPMTAPLAVATAKRYLAEDRHRIRLHELVTGETERLYGGFSDEAFPLYGGSTPNEEEFKTRVERYRRTADVLLALTVTGCYWDERPGKGVWEDSVQRIANPQSRPGGTFYPLWDELRLYPALLLLYGGGLAAVASGNYSRLAPLLSQTRRRDLNWEGPLVLRANASQFLARDTGDEFRHLLTCKERAYFPVSEHLHETLREPLRQYLPDDESYDGCFDRFEYLLALVYVDLEDKRGDEYFAGPGLWGADRALRLAAAVRRASRCLTEARRRGGARPGQLGAPARRLVRRLLRQVPDRNARLRRVRQKRETAKSLVKSRPPTSPPLSSCAAGLLPHRVRL